MLAMLLAMLCAEAATAGMFFQIWLTQYDITKGADQGTHAEMLISTSQSRQNGQGGPVCRHSNLESAMLNHSAHQNGSALLVL